MRAFRRLNPSRWALVAAAITTVACAKAAATPEAVSPERGLRTLTANDDEVSNIAVAAAKYLPPVGTTRPYFAGVFVDRRKARSASDAVVRATGFTAVNEASRSTRPPECRVVNRSTGATTTVPCPASVTVMAAAVVPPTYTFAAVRATADSAYVGITTKTTGTPEESCMTLVRSAGTWTVLRTTVATSAEHCGK